MRRGLHDDVEEELVGLVAGGVERVLELHDVRVLELLHDLQLAVLVPLVLEHLRREGVPSEEILTGRVTRIYCVTRSLPSVKGMRFSDRYIRA